MDVRQIMLILTILVCFSTATSEATFEESLDEILERQRVENEFRIKKDYNEAYQMLVDTLKWHEGFRANPYYCLADVLTVGYGHAIKKGDKFNYPLSEQRADSLLREDLNAAIAFVEYSTDLEHTQLLAIAHFVYALGSGRFENSTLRELIANDLPIDREIVKWVHIRTKTGIIRSEHLVKSRRMELELYNLLET